MSVIKDDMESLVEVLKKVTDSGYHIQFQATEKGLFSFSTKKYYTPDEVNIVHFYRFEGESNPDDSSILYTIETTSGERGTLIDSFGAYNDPLITDFIKAVESIHK